MFGRVSIVSPLCALTAVFLLFTACHKKTEEEKVRKVITGVQQAAEEKKVLSVLEHISRSYQDPQGNDYDGVKGLLIYHFFRHRSVSVYIPSIDITVSGTTAAARFEAVLAGRGTDEGTAGALLPDTLGSYDFEVQLRKEKEQWKVTSAKWQRSGGGDALP